MINRYFVLFIFFSILAATAMAQGNASMAKATPVSSSDKRWDLNKYVWSHTHSQTAKGNKPPLDFYAIDHWVSIGDHKDIALSDDGKYFAYTLRNQPYLYNTLIVRSTGEDGWEKSFVDARAGFFSADNKLYLFKRNDTFFFVGAGTSNLQYVVEVVSYKQSGTGSAEWVAYQLKDGGVVLRQLSTGKEQRYEGAGSYSFDKSNKWFCCQLKNKDKDLLLYNLQSGETLRFAMVTGYVIADSGNEMVLKTLKQVGDVTMIGLQYVDLSTGKTMDIWGATDNKEMINSIVIDPKGGQFVYIVGLGKESVNSIWYWRKGMEKAVLRVNDQTPGIAANCFIESVWFSSNGRHVFFYLQKRPDLCKADPDAVKVDVWSYRDTNIQTMQFAMMNNPVKYCSAVSIEGGSVIRIDNENESLKMLLNGGDFIVIAKSGKVVNGDRFWEKGYDLDSSWLVDLNSDKRILLKTNTREGFWFSPGGNYLVYFDAWQGCNYFSYNLQTGKLVNISRFLPAWSLGFKIPNRPYHTDPDARVGLAGWLADDKGVLVYDNHDIWQLDLAGKKPPLNITRGYGLAHQVIFKLVDRTDFDLQVPVVKEGDTLLLKAFSEVTMYNGFYRQVVGEKSAPQLLYMGPCVMTQAALDIGMLPIKAAQAEGWVVERQSPTEAPNYYFTADFKNYRPMSNVHGERKYNWLTAELHHFKQTDGIMNQGNLYKPENFDPSRKYPVIIGFYDVLSDRIYEYLAPDYTTSPQVMDQIPWLVSHGYLVFTPDIYYNPRRPGASTLNSVEGAVEYLSKLPYVDSHHMAACGHSRSGKLAYYVLTHSKNFAAMSIGASVIDVINSSLSLPFAYKGASRLEVNEREMGNIWENRDLWQAESPIMSADKVTTPVLMVHNNKDIVPGQTLEMFIALRRLNKKAWWLQYDDGGHVVGSIKDGRDLTIRTTQFYDHYLKGAPVPRWMTIGIPAKLKGIEDGYDLDGHGVCGDACPVCKNHRNTTKD